MINKIAFLDGLDIMAAREERDVGYPGVVWMDVPEGYSKEKRYRLEDGEIFERPVAEYDPKRLRVYRVLPETSDPLISDFTILGFRKESPSYVNGRKTRSTYMCAEKEEIIVEKLFSDVVEFGVLAGIEVTFNWYCEDDTIGLTKTEIVKKLNKYEAETEQRKRRERSIDYLVAGARGTPVEPYMTEIFDHYYAEVLVFKTKGSDEFRNAVLNETSAIIQSYLAIEIPLPTGGTVTVKDTILGQIS